MSDLRRKLASDLQDTVNQFASDIGTTRPTFGYLGKGDGARTIVNQGRKATREVWCYTSDSGRKSMPFSAVLEEGSGIPYSDEADNVDLAVVLAAPPGTDKLHVTRPNGLLAYETPNGESPLDMRVPRRAVLFHEDALVVTGNALFIQHDATQDYGFIAYQSAAANNDKFSHSFFLRAGTYTFTSLGATTVTGGNVAWSLDDAAAFLSGDSWYTAGANTANVRHSTGGVVVAQSGYHKLTGLVSAGTGAGFVVKLTRYGFVPAAD